MSIFSSTVRFESPNSKSETSGLLISDKSSNNCLRYSLNNIEQGTVKEIMSRTFIHISAWTSWTVNNM